MSLISVIIPAYNAAEYLETTIRSVLWQTYPHVETIVVDDGSTDATPEVLRRFRGEVRYLRQENAGPSAARNAGLAVARGDYVTFLDGDDAFYPRRLETLVGALHSASPAAAFATTDAWLWDGRRCPRRFRISTPSPGERDLATFLDETWCYIGILARRDRLAAAGGFRTGLWHCEDYDLWLRLLAGGGTYAYVPEPLYLYRGRDSGLSRMPGRLIEAALRVEQDALRSLPLTWGERRRLSFLAWEDRARVHAVAEPASRSGGPGARAAHLLARAACLGVKSAIRPGVCLSRLASRGTADGRLP